MKNSIIFKDDVILINSQEIKIMDLQNNLCIYTVKEIATQLNISVTSLNKIIKYYSLNYNHYEILKQRKFYNDIKDIDLNLFKEFYLSHSRAETVQYFNISVSLFFKLKDYLGLIKDKDEIAREKKQTMIKNFGSIEEANLQMVRKQQITNLNRYGNSNWHKSNDYLSKKEDIQHKTIKTNLEKYGCTNVFQNKEIIEKSKQTKFSKYQDSNYTNKPKQKQTCLERYGVENYCELSTCRDKAKNYLKTHKDSVNTKRVQTNLNRFGVDNYTKTPEYKKFMQPLYKNLAQKVIASKRLHNTFNKSSLEELLYNKLIEKYGTSDVFRNYNLDTRYPFMCDFYIKSLDLFIEVNNFPTHGKEPFDKTNQNHLKLLEQYKTSPKNWIEKKCVDIWAGTDILKYNTAIKEHLNYIMLYSKQDVLNYIKSLEIKEL